jgi:serine/threonine protein kinase
MAHAGDAPIDRYVVLEHLSEGGMGAIYVGKKLGAGGFEMEVVLKQLLPEFTQQEEFIDLFLREAKLSATLDHANIVHTIDLVTAGSEYFIVMEYLPGGDLRTLLKKIKKRGKRLSPGAAIYIARELLSALSYAHSKRDFDGQPLRLIHRDVSPSNILLSYSGEVKLTDFGIAKAATHTSLFYKVKGKIGYMSPEQAKSDPLDHRSDLYSLAVCMYEILTGERLFVHAGLTTSADEIYSQPVPQVSKKVPGVPPELDQLLMKALSISADARFQTAGEFQEALMRCAHRNGLLMSAPELAKELVEKCGPIDGWRNDEGEEDIDDGLRAGTEVYDNLDEEDDDDDQPNSISPVSIHGIAQRMQSSQSGPKPRPKTEIDRLNGVELTSIINMIDLEDKAGSKPLVDLDSDPAYPRLDSGPRELTHLESPLPQHLPQPSSRDSRDSRDSIEDLPATAPRRLPAPGPSQMAPQMMAPQQMQQQRPMQPRQMQQHRMHSPRGMTVAPRRQLKTWVVVVAILIVAGIAAAIVAMSGPDIPHETTKSK